MHVYYGDTDISYESIISVKWKEENCATYNRLTIMNMMR